MINWIPPQHKSTHLTSTRTHRSKPASQQTEHSLLWTTAERMTTGSDAGHVKRHGKEKKVAMKTQASGEGEAALTRWEAGRKHKREGHRKNHHLHRATVPRSFHSKRHQSFPSTGAFASKLGVKENRFQPFLSILKTEYSCGGLRIIVYEGIM